VGRPGKTDQIYNYHASPHIANTGVRRPGYKAIVMDFTVIEFCKLQTNNPLVDLMLQLCIKFLGCYKGLNCMDMAYVYA